MRKDGMLALVEQAEWDVVQLRDLVQGFVRGEALAPERPGYRAAVLALEQTALLAGGLATLRAAILVLPDDVHLHTEGQGVG